MSINFEETMVKRILDDMNYLSISKKNGNYNPETAKSLIQNMAILGEMAFKKGVFDKEGFMDYMDSIPVSLESFAKYPENLSHADTMIINPDYSKSIIESMEMEENGMRLTA